ncbi:MAG TPA: 4'-phosphopantetheinyl transferase superfamily protein [Acidobacteriaceae bacterium]|nr:4'-phosphopantetheinyl transferase superfamily protein [Acidobacteriaceae bacterium]
MKPAELRARILRAQPPLGGQTVHVWRTALSTITPLADDMRALLSADEHDRADRFRFPEHRNAFIAGRAVLRMVLGSYCGCAPEKLHFSYGEQQKPGVDEIESPLARTVSFNLSHSADELQIAVAAQGALGIDVEDPGREFDVDALIADCLMEDEARALTHLSSEQRKTAFIRYWVHKEAFLKCVGTGFSVSPKEIHVAFDGGRSEMRCSNLMANNVLFGRNLHCAPGHLAAIATAEREYELLSIVL